MMAVGLTKEQQLKAATGTVITASYAFIFIGTILLLVTLSSCFSEHKGKTITAAVFLFLGFGLLKMSESLGVFLS